MANLQARSQPHSGQKRLLQLKCYLLLARSDGDDRDSISVHRSELATKTQRNKYGSSRAHPL